MKEESECIMSLSCYDEGSGVVLVQLEAVHSFRLLPLPVGVSVM